ncbi:MAG: protein kinase [Huintestinicola sp.]
MLKKDSVIGGRYRVESKLGEGGSAVIYKCADMNDGKYVAVKLADSVSGREAVRREYGFISALSCSGIPKAYELIEGSDHTAAVIEFIEGENLYRKLDNGNVQLSLEDTLQIMDKVCRTVGYIHSCDPAVIHGDIKPQNIMLTDDGSVFIIDFGNSAYLGTSSPYPIGKSNFYSAPEIACLVQENDADTDKTVLSSVDQDKTVLASVGSDFRLCSLTRAADIYSLGAVASFMLSGKKTAVRFRSKSGRVIEKAMAEAPDERYPTAEMFFNELRSVSEKPEKRVKIKTAAIPAAVFAAVVAVTGFSGLTADIGNAETAGPLEQNTVVKEDYDYLYGLCESFLAQGSYSELSDAAVRLSEGYPERYSGYYFRGMAYLECGDSENAAVQFGKAYEAGISDNAQREEYVLRFLGEHFFASGDIGKSAEAYSSLLSCGYAVFEDCCNYAAVLEKLDDVDGVRETYEYMLGCEEFRSRRNEVILDRTWAEYRMAENGSCGYDQFDAYYHMYYPEDESFSVLSQHHDRLCENELQCLMTVTSEKH